MIQRIQSVYLLLAAIVAGALPFVVSIFTLASGEVVSAVDDMMFLIPFIVSAVLAVVAIFLFKNRQLQTVVSRLNIILNFILLGVFVYQLLMMSGEAAVSEKGIGMFLPILSIVLLVLANRAIRKDEQLVKSADRLR